MTIIQEVHTPGLDMEQSRWTYHLVFMKEVHENVEEAWALARSSYASVGRGTLFVSKDQWMDVVRDAVTDEPVPFACSYVSEEKAPNRFEFGMTADGFTQVLREYDPETQVVLTVEHHPGDLLSCYVIELDQE